jgi:hypothetical protein
MINISVNTGDWTWDRRGEMLKACLRPWNLIIPYRHLSCHKRSRIWQTTQLLGHFVAGHFVARLFHRVQPCESHGSTSSIAGNWFNVKLSFFERQNSQFYIKLDFQLSKMFNNGIHKFLRYATKWTATKWPRDGITHDEMSVTKRPAKKWPATK